MKHMLIFAGTTEGRKLTEYFLTKQVSVTVCTATEYGKNLLPSNPELNVLSGRLDAENMYELMKKYNFDAVFDATHPYATIASENIKSAAKKANLPYTRILRPEETVVKNHHFIYVNSTEEAVSFLSDTRGNILTTTGSKDLACFCSLPDYRERIYARILPEPDMLRNSLELGFQGSHLVCMQGPFSEELNTALIHQFRISYMVTKNSGKVGGFLEKIASAEKNKCILIIIGRPKEETNGILLEDLIKYPEPQK